MSSLRLTGQELLALIDAEIAEASPGWSGPYRANDHVAPVLMDAPKTERLCQ